VAAVKSVGPEGKGNPGAAAAWQVLAAAGADSVPALLVSMDGANDYAINWLRAAVEAIAQREAAAGRPVSVVALEQVLQDTSHHPRARRLAYEMIARADPARARVLLPEFVNDPGTELRREAVAALAADAASRATAGDKAAAAAGYRKALGYAREADQVDALAQTLRDLGETVDLREILGWVTRWEVIGPFDNTGGTGFASEFPPETPAGASGEVPGKSGAVRWQPLETKDDHGMLDFNKPFSPLKEVTGYARTEFWSDAARPAEIRLGCKNGWKVWWNGKLLFGRDEYHRAAEMDQYRLPVQIQSGKNVLLVKCCQNEQTEDWTKEWEFQLRVTDAQGTPIRSTR
ncbi:MAG: hypothetical protein J0L84_14345, partial [Verrucomicrobia bacterium]|nr:hypothetical protein [Verrucomicrobiota bacterium]